MYVNKATIDASDLAIILPVRLEHSDRRENFDAVLRYFTRFFHGFELVIVESDKRPQLDTLTLDVPLRYHFLQNEGVLHKTLMLNIGAQQSEKPLILCYDTDVLFRPEALGKMLDIFRSHPDQHFGIPYNLIQLDIDGPDKAALIADFDFSRFPQLKEAQLNHNYGDSAICWNPEGVGGATFFRRKTFLEGGGYNKELMGCYWEDYEIVARFTLLGHAPFTLADTNLYHLHHRRSNTGQQDPLWHHNEALYNQILQMNPESLKHYIAKNLLPLDTP